MSILGNLLHLSNGIFSFILNTENIFHVPALPGHNGQERLQKGTIPRMKEQSFWQLLRDKHNDLTKSGRLVADYLVQHPEEAQYLSISSLAKACGVAEATIFRFCRSLGFDGYNEMKIALAQANAAAEPAATGKPEPGSDTAALCAYSAAVCTEAITGTRDTLDPTAIDAAATLLQRARQVYCFGQGGSHVLANDIWARFATVTTKFHTAGDSHMQALTASLMGPEDVVLFVSYSGATRDMLETLRLAKSCGARIILLTHYADSPGASLADVVLLCGAQESPLEGGSIAAKIAMLYVTEVLVLRFTMDNLELTTIAKQRTSRALAPKLL